MDASCICVVIAAERLQQGLKLLHQVENISNHRFAVNSCYSTAAFTPIAPMRQHSTLLWSHNPTKRDHHLRTTPRNIWPDLKHNSHKYQPLYDVEMKYYVVTI